MNCNIPIEQIAEHERAAAVWKRMSPAQRELARVEHERQQRSLALFQRRAIRAVSMVN